MMINTNAMISITEANQNFSKVARMVDTNGSAVILKNNTPRYLIISFDQAEGMQTAKDLDKVAEKVQITIPVSFGNAASGKDIDFRKYGKRTERGQNVERYMREIRDNDRV